MDAGRYAYYWRALKEGDFSGWDAEDAPFPGFYRWRPSARDEFQPVAFWDLPPPLRAVGIIGRRTGGRGFSRSTLNSVGARAAIWMGCYGHPISEDQFNHALTWGEWWDSLRAAGDDAGPGRIVTDIDHAQPIGPPSLRRSP